MWLQSDLKEHVKGDYEFRNKRNGNHIIIKMADYSAMKSCLEKNNLYYFTSSYFEKPIKAVIHHFHHTWGWKKFQLALRIYASK
jgi:hypothetical protein